MNGKKLLIHTLSGIIAALAIIGLLYIGQLTPTTQPLTQFSPYTFPPTEIPSPEFNFALTITDPPILPEGVSAVYLSYEDIHIHSLSMSSWISLQQSDTLNLLGLIEVAQLIALSTIPEGKYDLIRFLNVSAIVTYENVNYTAKMPSDQLLVNISPPLEVSGNTIKSILLQLIPRVIITYTEKGKLDCLLIPFSQAIIVEDIWDLIPKNINLKDAFETKIKIPLKHSKVFNSLLLPTNFGKVRIINAAIFNNTLTFTVINEGNSTVNLKMAFVSGFLFGSVKELEPKEFFIKAFFLILPNGSLKLLTGFKPNDLVEIYYTNEGYVLNPGESKTFEYKGLNIYKLPEYLPDFQKFLKIKILSLVLVVIGEPLVFAKTIVAYD